MDVDADPPEVQQRGILPVFKADIEIDRRGEEASEGINEACRAELQGGRDQLLPSGVPGQERGRDILEVGAEHDLFVNLVEEADIDADTGGARATQAAPAAEMPANKPS